MVTDLPTLPALGPDDMSLGADPSLLHDELRYVITQAIANEPRSLQKEIGISEIGTPCVRRLAYQLAEMPAVNASGVPWRAAVGRCVHTWLQEIFITDNRRHGFTRWLTETRVNPGEIDGVPLFGHSDMYDRVTASVVDWKVPGPTAMKGARKDGPKPGYRVQAHTYGLGYTKRGLPVERVHIAFLPSAGELSDAVWWSEPYDEEVALAALERASDIRKMINQLGIATVAMLSTGTTDYCTYCDWFSPGKNDPASGNCCGSDEMVKERARKVQSPPSPW